MKKRENITTPTKNRQIRPKVNSFIQPLHTEGDKFIHQSALESFKLLTKTRNRIIYSTALHLKNESSKIKAYKGLKKSNDFSGQFLTPKKPVHISFPQSEFTPPTGFQNERHLTSTLSKDYNFIGSYEENYPITPIYKPKHAVGRSIEIKNSKYHIVRYLATDFEPVHVTEWKQGQAGFLNSEDTEKCQIITELSNYSLDDEKPIPSQEKQDHYETTERLNEEQLNDDIVYTNGGIGIVKKPIIKEQHTPFHKKGGYQPIRRHFKTSTGASSTEIMNLKEEIQDRRSRISVFNASLGGNIDPRRTYSSIKPINVYNDLIKEEEAYELELTPEENMRIHTVTTEYRPSPRFVRHHKFFNSHRKALSSTIQFNSNRPGSTNEYKESRASLIELDSRLYPVIEIKGPDQHNDVCFTCNI